MVRDSGCTGKQAFKLGQSDLGVGFRRALIFSSTAWLLIGVIPYELDRRDELPFRTVPNPFQGKCLGCRLEKLDYVSRGIEAKGLLAATIFYNVVLKLHSLLLESRDLRFDIVHDDLKSSPASGPRSTPMSGAPVRQATF